jgi:hypothetical protein
MIFDLYFFQTERSVPLSDKKPMLPLFIYCAFHCALHTYHNQISHLIYDIFLFFPAKYHARQTRNPSCCTRRMTDALTDNSDKRLAVVFMGWASARIRANGGATRVKKKVMTSRTGNIP